ncbi:MAG: fibronectin/fibrinogen-binding protein [Clostridiales bacterium]|nr:fibronectin/fibrinogen-binding protein [Clostridiales bacterium]
MPQDAFTLRHLCKELSSTFTGGKINRIVQPSENDVVFTIYTGKKTERLVLDVNPARPRIGLDKMDRESPLTAPNFCMLLRKHLLSATIEEISLVGFDRIVKIEMSTSSEFSDPTEKTLYVELMGRYSNIILTENGKILGGNRGINCFDAGVRPLIVGRNYVLPPTNEKVEPSTENLIKYLSVYSGENLAEYICQGVQGVASSTIIEVLSAYAKKCGVGIDAITLQDYVKIEKLAKFISDFLYNPPVSPCIIKENGKPKDVCVFPYECVSGEVEKYPSLMQAESEYFTRKITEKRIADKSERIKSVLKSAEKKAQKRLSAILGKERDAIDAEKDKITGELILANVYKISKGDKSVKVENYYDEYKEIEIPLNEFLSPSENAETYYKRYAKKKRTLISLLPQKEKAEAELSYVRSVSDEFLLCETEEEIDGVIAELKESGLIKDASKKKKKEQTNSCRKYEILGYTVKVGRNNVENDYLVTNAHSKDVWLHSKDYHSSHALISYEGKEIPEKVILLTAEIVAYYSKARTGGKSEVVYTEKKHVKKPSGAKLGFCTYTDFKSVTVNANRHDEFLKCK